MSFIIYSASRGETPSREAMSKIAQLRQLIESLDAVDQSIDLDALEAYAPEVEPAAAPAAEVAPESESEPEDLEGPLVPDMEEGVVQLQPASSSEDDADMSFDDIEAMLDKEQVGSSKAAAKLLTHERAKAASRPDGEVDLVSDDEEAELQAKRNRHMALKN